MEDILSRPLGALCLIALIAAIVVTFRMLRWLATSSMTGHHLVRLSSAVASASFIGVAAHSIHAVAVVPADHFPKRAHPEVFIATAVLALVPIWFLLGRIVSKPGDPPPFSERTDLGNRVDNVEGLPTGFLNLREGFPRRRKRDGEMERKERHH